MSDAIQLAAAMLGGPWRAELIAIRIAHAAGRLSVSLAARELAGAVLERFATAPKQGELVAFLEAGQRAAGLVDALAITGDGPPKSALQAGFGGDALNLDGLARLLDIDQGELAWFADVQSRERRTPSPLRHYRWTIVPKRGGVRLLAAPKPRLKEIQRRVLRNVLASIPIHPAAHGCVPGRSVATALEPHAGAGVLIRVDLEGFFATISRPRVQGLLRVAGARQPVASALAGLCTTIVPADFWARVPRPNDPSELDAHVRLGERLRVPHLPPGAPTSPALANAVCFGIDRRLTALAGRFGATYTRYVDDLIFSGSRSLTNRSATFLAAAEDLLRQEGFRMARHKTTVRTSAARQSVLGAVVNHHVTLSRHERDRLRAILHNCQTHGWRSQAHGVANFHARTLGQIAAAAALDPALGVRLKNQFGAIDWA